MIFDINALGSLNKLSIYIAQPSGDILGCIDDIIDETSARLRIGLNQMFELSFTVNDPCDGTPSWYDEIQEGIYLFVEKVGLFKMLQPNIVNDGTVESKDVTAYSCDTELEDKNCDLELNMGVETSQEYLVTYDEDETESLVNPYTNIPYDWLVLYNLFPEQLTEFLAKYDNGYFGTQTGEDIVVEDQALMDELQEFFNLIPRLKNKIVEVTDEAGGTDYSLIEYVFFDYDATGETLTKITLRSNFRDRVLYLIDFYTKYRDQLSLLTIVLENTGYDWSIGEIYGVADGDYSLANRKYQFDISSTIYAFFTQTLAQTTRCIAQFDIVNRKINLIPVEEIGEDTGISLSYKTLVNSISVSTNEDRLATRLFVTGQSDLGIGQVNFGLEYVEDLNYKINVRDRDGRRIYVSDELAEKYKAYMESREEMRKEYVELSKEYNRIIEQIDELQYRVPNDSVQIDWGTYSEDELEASLTAYKNLLASLLSLYKEDYGSAGVNDDDSVKESFIKDTPYWYDYVAYKNTITEIECALSVFPYYSDQSKWTAEEIAQYKDAISAWETEWSLYGIVELQAKIDTYKQNMDILAQSAVVRVSEDSDEIKKWDELTDAERTDYGEISANYYYDVYMEYYNNKKSAEEYLQTLLDEKAALEKRQEEIQNRRLELSDLAKMENNFTPEEYVVLYRLYRDADYQNENILVTNIDDVNERIDIMEELLMDGREQASIFSRPQLQFDIDSDNILALPVFESIWKEFRIGNYMMVQYKDDLYIKLRMVEYEFNPCLPPDSDFSMTFSNYIKSTTGISDLEDLLGLSTASTSRNSSGGSGNGGSAGKYGESDDIDVTISNTMLEKLLSSEQFGSRVTNVILDTLDVNALTARKATFNGLANGTTIIDGKCVTTGYIRDFLYNGKDGDISNTEGSVLNLDTGLFNFAGGKLKYDGNGLSVQGHIKADSGYIGGENGFTILPGRMYSGNHSSWNSNNDGVYVGTDYVALGPNAMTYFKSDGSGKIGPWHINSTSIWKGSSSFRSTGSGNMYFGDSGLSITDNFYVTSDGYLYAKYGEFAGTVHASAFTANTSTSSMELNANSLQIDATQSDPYVHVGNSTKYCDLYPYALILKTVQGSKPDPVERVWDSYDYGVLYVNVTSASTSSGYAARFNMNGSLYATRNMACQTLYAGSDGGSTNYYFNANGKLSCNSIEIYTTNSKYWGFENNGEIFCSAVNVGDSSGSGQWYGIDSSASALLNDLSCDRIDVRSLFFANSDEYYLSSEGNVWCHNLYFADGSTYRLSSGGDVYCRNVYFATGTTYFLSSTGAAHIDRIYGATGIYSAKGSGNGVIVTSTGNFMSESSSSRKYKNSIEDLHDDNLNPEKLYDIPVRQFKYNQGYLVEDDQRCGVTVPGFIAEEVYDIYPVAVNLEGDNEPENWNTRYIIPPMLALIQKQHKEIEELKSELQEIKAMLS